MRGRQAPPTERGNMSHHGVRLRIEIPAGVILDMNSDYLYFKGQFAGPHVLQTTDGLVITAEPVELPDDYPDYDDYGNGED